MGVLKVETSNRHRRVLVLGDGVPNVQISIVPSSSQYSFVPISFLPSDSTAYIYLDTMTPGAYYVNTQRVVIFIGWGRVLGPIKLTQKYRFLVL